MKVDILFQKINKISYLSFFFFSFLLFGESTTLEDIEEGKRYLNANDCKKAITYFQSALLKNPNSLEAKIGYADCTFKVGSYNESKKYYLEVLKRDNKNIPAVTGICEIYLAESKFKEISDILNPLLTEFPNNTTLRISEAKLFLKQGKLDSAIFKLNQLNEKLNYPASLQKMLATLYFEKKAYNDSILTINRYIQSEPNDPEGFVFKAKALLYQNYFYPSKLGEILPDVEYQLENALNLDPKNEGARFYSVYLNLIRANEKDGPNKDKLKLAFQTIYKLAREFPENKLYHLIEANIAWTLKEKNFASYHYRKSLQLDDLDELVRFEAEEYVLTEEKEESKLRRELGNYRKERFYAEKHSLYHKSSIFHLLRARDLSPQTPQIRRELLDFYNLSGESVLFTNLLIRLREEDQSQFKLENKLEFSIQSIKNSLEYKEGYIQIQPNQILEKVERFSPEIYVFDFESVMPFPEHLAAGRLLSNALRYNLKYIQNIRVVDGEEFSTTRKNLKLANFHPFSETLPFSVDNLHLLDEQRKNNKKVRYVLHGRYSYENGELKVEMYLYDRKSLKDISFLKTSQKGRDALPTVIGRMAEKIQSVLPKEGKILKIKKEEVLISMGKVDGLSIKSKLEFLRDEKVILTGDITDLGKHISLVKLNKRGWEKELATGDFVRLKTGD
ncbi:hypothetical protein P3G55_02860 [Leptospira sp. 96542]|nr:hypothetical protein [Leptospira sp. 96542]